MIIGIHVGAAFSDKKTGVEEYVFRLIEEFKNLKDAKKHTFILYVNPKINKIIPKNLPNNFSLKVLHPSFFWTNFRLLLELLKDKPDVFFMPANFFLFFYPKIPVVTSIHGLEFEYFPKYYSKKMLFYLKTGTKRAIKKSKKIISISERTKKDLASLYNADLKNINVVHHGVAFEKFKKPFIKREFKYILYIGRIELKKNILGILDAFYILKKKYKIEHKLILAGYFGYGGEKIKKKIDSFKYKDDVILPGYISHDEKKHLFSNADIFLFPSFYEGFGMPILEAQSFGVPVVTSENSSTKEVGSDGALYVDPNNADDIAKAVFLILSDREKREEIIKNGRKNLDKYSWSKCAKETLKILESVKK